jgi:predicted helicase
VNLDPRFLRELADALDWIPTGQAAGDLNGTFGAEDVLHYIYALFHSDGYRTRYADLLRCDFPRVFLPRQAALFAQLSQYGRCLAAAHLLRVPAEQGAQEEAGISTDDWTIAPGYPKYAAGRVSIHRQQVLAEVPQRVWDFQVGGHQVCRKWLKDRRGRTLRPDQRRTYQQMVAAIGQTLDWSQRIDQAIAAHGGWPEAFLHGTNAARVQQAL